MKKVLAALLVLALVAPAMADVSVTAADNGTGKLLISFTTSGDPAPVVRGMALTLSITGGNVASAAAFLDSDFNTFIDYAFTNPTGYDVGVGHPLAITGSAGELVTFPATDLAVSVGYLDQGGNQAGLASGVVVELQLSGIASPGCATVAISANSVRGGAVVGDNLGTVTVEASQDVCLAPTHTVSVPTVPTVLGGKFFAGQALPVSTGGSVDAPDGHAVQYQFDWGDGTTSAWGTGVKISKSYATAGATYTILAQARCAVDNLILSPWSAGFTHTVSSECQKFNLTKRINAATDNTLNVSDLNLLVAYVNANRSVSSVFAVLASSPAYDARYNFDATATINVGDLNALVGFVNAARTNSAVFARICPATP